MVYIDEGVENLKYDFKSQFTHVSRTDFFYYQSQAFRRLVHISTILIASLNPGASRMEC